MICTPEQVRAITGKKRCDAQRRALIKMRIEHIVRPDNTLVVAIARVEHLLGVKANAKVVPSTSPNWDALAPSS